LTHYTSLTPPPHIPHIPILNFILELWWSVRLTIPHSSLPLTSLTFPYLILFWSYGGQSTHHTSSPLPLTFLYLTLPNHLHFITSPHPPSPPPSTFLPLPNYSLPTLSPSLVHPPTLNTFHI
jgi:hypothetical protein